MSDEQNRQKTLVDTTDCLEAVGVFRCWKNLFFVVTFAAMLALGACFWLLNAGLIDDGNKSEVEQIPTQVEQVVQESQESTDEATEEIEQAARQVTSDANAPAEAKSSQETKATQKLPVLREAHVMWTIRAADFVLIAAAVLYCLTILFTLKISMVGRLGGINHISRAFFWSLIFIVLVLPWQAALGWGLFGVTFEPSELIRRIGDYDSDTIFLRGLFWLRFVGLWVVALLCLVLAQIRTARWSKATLRRLEVI